MRPYPHLYEINTQLFLKRLSVKGNTAPLLTELPDDVWKTFSTKGFDLIWLMGVWQRSPASRKQALRVKSLRERYDVVLPGWKNHDITGSPYAVYEYSCNSLFGSQDSLRHLRTKLNQNDLKLILDFVPNHFARDNKWTMSRPAYFIRGSKEDAAEFPDSYFSPHEDIYIAHGKDPNFPSWTDTAQVNIFSTSLRKALVNILLQIADQADGVRCDMAMLLLNDVFERTWGNQLQRFRRPDTEFWTEAIEKVRERHSGFIFIAEAYWGLETQLQQAGFDFIYDKTLYDRVRFSTAADILDYLRTHDPLEHHSVYFIENHDEQRAVTAFGRERSIAAAVVVMTLPCLRLIHDGQLEGKRIQIPVQLMREPEDAHDPDIEQFYNRLLSICNHEVFHNGTWKLIESNEAFEKDVSYTNLLAWSWHYNEQVKIVVTNYSPNSAQSWIKPRLQIEGNGTLELEDELTGTKYRKEVAEIREKGLYIDLKPYHSHIFSVNSS
jgi:glycosidase